MSTIKNPDSEIANLEKVEHDSKTNESIDQPSADDNTITEMDAIQKHVEESLLFLDHDKTTNIVSDKTDQNVESSTLIDPTSKLDLEVKSKVEEENDEKKLDITDEHNDNEVASKVEEEKDEKKLDITDEHNDNEVASKVEEEKDEKKFDITDEHYDNEVASEVEEEKDENKLDITDEHNDNEVASEVEEVKDENKLDITDEPNDNEVASEVEEEKDENKLDITDEPNDNEVASKVEEEKDENIDIADEHNENEDSGGSFKLPVIVSVQDTHNETSTSIAQAPIVTDITEKVDNENNVYSELSQISSTQIKVEESPATIKQDAPQKMDEDPPQVSSVQECIQEIIEPVKEGANVSIVSDMDVNTESEEICHENINKNVPTEIVWESQTKEQAQAPEKMDEHNISIHETQNQAQNETSKVSKNNDEPMELQSDVVQENLICSENVEQIPGDPFETEIEKDTSDNVHLESSKTAQEMKNIEKMDEDVKKDHVEPSMNPQESVGGSPTTKDDKEVETSNNKDGNVAHPESTQTGALIAVQECPVQSTLETMDEDPNNVHMESSEIVMEQDNLEEASSQPGDKIEDTITKNKIISNNDIQPITAINDEVIDIIEPTQITATPQNIAISPPEQAQELTNVIQIKEEPVPIQNTTKRPLPQETQIKLKKDTENLPYNTNIQSPSNVVTIYDNTECTPGKRARLEPSCSTVVVKTENAANEPVTSSENASVDVIEVLSPGLSGAQVETAPEPESYRPQSPCPSIVEDNIIDVDADQEVLPLSETKIHGDINIEEFVKWCEEHNICHTFKNHMGINLRMNLRHLKPFKFAAKYNKSVLKLGHIPKSLNQTDVYQVIKKYTQHAGEDIAKNIAYIHLDKTSNLFFNTAYVKWRDNQKYLTIKALEIMRKAELKLEGNKVPVKYDDRMAVEWDENEKPISKEMLDNPGRKINLNMTTTQITEPPCAPFRKGEIDYNDKDMYGLSNEFLLRHNITAPLTSHVVVNNAIKTLNEGYVYKVFGMAGNILSLILEPVGDCQSLRIQYDHPVEAVQAISMFDKKSIYGQTVSVVMDNSAKFQSVMPEGCSQIGPGLGADGLPLKGVRCQIEVGILRAILNKEISRLKFKIYNSRAKINEALNTQTKINNNLKKNLATTPKPFEQTAQNSPALQNPQNAINDLSTAITSSVQNNLLGMLGLQPNLLQGLVCLNQNNVAPNWSAPNPELHCWSQPNAQPSFSPNMEHVTNIQLPGTMQNSPGVQVPTQPTAIQPIDINMQQAYTQPGFSNIQPEPSTIQSAQYAHSGLINQAAVVTTHKNPVLYDTDISKPPPVVAKPQNRGQIHTYPSFSNIQPEPLNIQSAQYAQSGLINQAAVVTTHKNPVLYDTDISKPRLDKTPPVVANPQNRGQIQTYPSFSNIQPEPLNIKSAQYAHSGLINQAAVVTTHKNPVLYDTDISKPRLDKPAPVVAKPQKRGKIQTYPNVAQSKPVPPEPIVKSFIPFPVAKAQIRGPVVSADSAFSAKTAHVVKPPKPVAIKFKIPFHVPSSPYGELELVPPVSDAQKRDKPPSSSHVGKQPAYQNVSPLPKSNPVVKEQPLINKKVKATKRPSKSPDRPRARSPRYDTSRATKRPSKSPDRPRARSPRYDTSRAKRRLSKSPERSRARSSRYETSKDDRRTTDSDYSREREREYSREKDREYSRERREEKDAGREKEPERDHRRPATLIFKYLPSSVSSEDLHDKMREVGSLVSAHVSGKGHALVTFKHARDAETCIEMYNKSKVDDKTIEVKWAN